ncbi:MAG: hypothetical protein K5657_09490 [Desulfovibrio sp.]|nr:hypothetical protein [Desulfovibrio sp.]
MKDERGIYYFPVPADRSLRVYVRKNADGEIEFRLWAEDTPEIWEKHPWLNHDILSRASNLYKEERNSNVNQLSLYDLSVAKSLLEGN